MIQCGERLEVLAVPGLPIVGAGDDLPALVRQALGRAGVALRHGDVVVVKGSKKMFWVNKFVPRLLAALQPKA